MVETNINVKIDAEVKDMALMLLGRMGLDHATAIDMFFRQIIAERRLPFQPSVPMTLDEQILAAVARSDTEKVELATDEDGNVFVDKRAHPEIYEWVENG